MPHPHRNGGRILFHACRWADYHPAKDVVPARRPPHNTHPPPPGDPPGVGTDARFPPDVWACVFTHNGDEAAGAPPPHTYHPPCGANGCSWRGCRPHATVGREAACLPDEPRRYCAYPGRWQAGLPRHDLISVPARCDALNRPHCAVADVGRYASGISCPMGDLEYRGPSSSADHGCYLGRRLHHLRYTTIVMFPGRWGVQPAVDVPNVDTGRGGRSGAWAPDLVGLRAPPSLQGRGYRVGDGGRLY